VPGVVSSADVLAQVVPDPASFSPRAAAVSTPQRMAAE
jgi:hypothetical protein